MNIPQQSQSLKIVAETWFKTTTYFSSNTLLSQTSQAAIWGAVVDPRNVVHAL